jgi:hypothetical protein
MVLNSMKDNEILVFKQIKNIEFDLLLVILFTKLHGSLNPKTCIHQNNRLISEGLYVYEV